MLIPVFPAALHPLRAVEKLSGFGSEVRRALHCAGQLCWPGGARDGRAPLIPCRELLRCQVAETRVRAQVVVVVSPRLDNRARFTEAAEHVLVEALVAQLAVERFDECVLHRLAW